MTTSPKPPSDHASDLEWLLFEQDGVCTTAQAVAIVGRGGLRAQMASGRWRRLCRGVIISHTGPLAPSQLFWAAVLACGNEAVLAGRAAATAAGLRLGSLDIVDVLVPKNHLSSTRLRTLPLEMPRVVAHRTGILSAAQVQRARPPRTTLPRSVVDAAAWAVSEEQARLIVAAAVQQRLVTVTEIRQAAESLSRLHRRALVLETLVDVELGATSSGELDFLRLCRRFRLPLPQLQYRRSDSGGRTRYLDAYWERWKVHVEIDGVNHMAVGQWEADLLRQNDVWLAGDRVLRFSARQVRHEPQRVAERIRAGLRTAGWDGTPDG